jgi:hypothetical protein
VIIDLIDKIIIHEPEGERGNRRQKIEIIYRFIGAGKAVDENAA